MKMKRVLKTLGVFAAVVTLVLLLSAPAQARVFVNFRFGFPLYYGPAYYPAYPYCYAPYYYAPPAYYYYGPRGHYYYRGGAWYYR
jgi:hypothetical protein